MMKKFITIIFTLAMIASLGSNAAAVPQISTTIPERAIPLLSQINDAQKKYWPTHSKPWIIASLIEHESCISLTHSRCWSPTSRLKTKREEGAGLGQITRAYHSDGRLRFDALQELRKMYPKELGELSWSNVYQRPDLQIRAVVLKLKSDFRFFKDTKEPYAFTDAAYNGGRAGVTREQRGCAVTPGCDPNYWFGHVEKICLKSKQPLYGNRSACDINRHHVKDVLVTRAEKYRTYWLNNF
jgi:hypothetical protein